MRIGERIFDLLQKEGMSQKEFSQKTGISQSTISDWKHKRLNPSSDRILPICEVLKVTPDQLLSGTESRGSGQTDYIAVNRDTEEYMLIQQYRELSKEDQIRLKGYLDALKKNMEKESMDS